MTVNGWLLFLAWLWPALLAALAPQGRFWWTPALGALPALVAAFLVPVGTRLELPWLLLGTVIGLDAIGHTFLLFTAILWLAAGIYAASSFRGTPAAGRFRTLFLLSMAGNLWLIVGQDLVSFYVGFTVMGLAAYGLVIHNGDAGALRAGRVYLIMTLVGEVALLMALVLIARDSGSLMPTAQQLSNLSDLAIGLTVVGLGIKAGIVPLHVWLPLAHPAAPVPASAVLSGTMIKVALLGWLRFLPLGEVAVPDWGALLVLTGVATTLLALPVGLVQSDPKVVLAYSSVSKMGLLVMGLGLILMEPALAPAGVSALALYAAHHALVKGGLFLGVGLRKHGAAGPSVVLGLAFLALALAGAPLTSGAVAKYGVKPLLAEAPWTWLTAAVTASTVGTTLLMVRFLWVIWATKPHPTPGYRWGGGAWIALMVLVLLFPFVLGSPAGLATNAAPVAIGVGLALPIVLLAWLRPALLKPLVDLVPPGDVLFLIRPLLLTPGRLLRALWRLWMTLLDWLLDRLGSLLTAHEKPSLGAERGLRQWPVAGVLWVGIGASLLLALIDQDVVWTQAEAPLERPASGPSPEMTAGPVSPLADIGQTEQLRSSTAKNAPAAEESVAAARRDGATKPPGERQDLANAGALDAAADGSPEGKDSLSKAVSPSAKSTLAAVPAPAPAEAEPPHSSGLPKAELAADAASSEKKEKDDCEPSPYIFRYLGEVESGRRVERQLNLVQCEVAGDGSRRLRDAPVLSNQLVELVQRSLQDLGFDPGPADGLIGPITRGAIRRFQADQGMKPDGLITFTLLDRLQQVLSEQKRQTQVD